MSGWVTSPGGKFDSHKIYLSTRGWKQSLLVILVNLKSFYGPVGGFPTKYISFTTKLKRKDHLAH